MQMLVDAEPEAARKRKQLKLDDLDVEEISCWKKRLAMVAHNRIANLLEKATCQPDRQQMHAFDDVLGLILLLAPAFHEVTERSSVCWRVKEYTTHRQELDHSI
jgi:hypothetical protein